MPPDRRPRQLPELSEASTRTLLARDVRHADVQAMARILSGKAVIFRLEPTGSVIPSLELPTGTVVRFTERDPNLRETLVYFADSVQEGQLGHEIQSHLGSISFTNAEVLIGQDKVVLSQRGQTELYGVKIGVVDELTLTKFGHAFIRRPI